MTLSLSVSENIGKLDKNNKTACSYEIMETWLCVTMILITVVLLSYQFASLYAIEQSLASDTTSNLTKNLRSSINNLISNALNETGNTLNSGILTNKSNLTSNNIIISNNKVTSLINSNDSTSSSSIIKDQVKTVNGICTSNKIGGNSNDTLASSGNCNDVLTGGAGADKFMCGGGDDIVKDYNSKEGDILVDKQNCEKIQ